MYYFAAVGIFLIMYDWIGDNRILTFYRVNCPFLLALEISNQLKSFH